MTFFIFVFQLVVYKQSHQDKKQETTSNHETKSPKKQRDTWNQFCAVLNGRVAQMTERQTVFLVNLALLSRVGTPPLVLFFVFYYVSVTICQLLAYFKRKYFLGLFRVGEYGGKLITTVQDIIDSGNKTTVVASGKTRKH